jgi:multimeric flavodoxin WrbA
VPGGGSIKTGKHVGDGHGKSTGGIFYENRRDQGYCGTDSGGVADARGGCNCGPASAVKKEADLDGYDAYVFGSATYHGEMMQSMKTMLFLAEKANLEGKVGGSFGAFGWSGEAPGRIYETMKNIFKMNMAERTAHAKVLVSGRRRSNGPGLREGNREGKSSEKIPIQEGLTSLFDWDKKNSLRISS